MELFRSADFAAYAKKLIDRNNVPGLAVAVVHNHEVESLAFGTASLETGQPFARDTLFCVGSAAKSLTAAAMSVLVGDNVNYPQVQFDTPMARLLPDDFVMPGDEHGDVTVEDVLSHRTGMAPHEYSILGRNAKQPDDARSITRNLRNLSCVAPNRAEHIYCNMMYTAASYMVEQVSGMAFGDFLEKHIFAPLAMDSTCFLRDTVRARGMAGCLASGYSWDRPGQRHREIRTNDGAEAQGAGQVYATVGDYLRWVKAMIHREGPVSDDLFRELTAPRIQQNPDDDAANKSRTFYALGWQVHQYGGYKIVSHDGGEPGFQCNHFFIPDFKFGGIIFSNADRAGSVVSLLMYRLIDELVHAGKPVGALAADDSDSDSESLSGSESEPPEDYSDIELELCQELSPGMGQPEPQKLPLAAYTGRYSHPGYHAIQVDDKDGALFFDATDRSYGFTLTMKHICDQSKYIAYVSQTFEEGDLPIKAEFRLDNDRATAIGIHLEDATEYIWFDRVDG